MKTLLFFCSILLITSKAVGQEAIHVKQLSDKGDPMIFLPHIGCSSEMWRKIAENYQRTNSCYLVDFAGFNGMKPMDTLYSDSYVKALARFIKKEKLENVTLIGQNYGAFIAVKLSADKSLKIAKIIASDFYPKLSMVLDPAMTPEKLKMLKDGIRSGTMGLNADAFRTAQKQTAEMMNFSRKEDVDHFVTWQEQSDRKTLAETLCEQFGTDLLPQMKENTIPILVFTTWYFAKTYKQMPISDATAKLTEMYGKTPFVKHAVTADAKDFIAIDQPEWFIAEMDKFLKTKTFGK